VQGRQHDANCKHRFFVCGSTPKHGLPSRVSQLALAPPLTSWRRPRDLPAWARCTPRCAAGTRVWDPPTRAAQQRRAGVLRGNEATRDKKEVRRGSGTLLFCCLESQNQSTRPNTCETDALLVCGNWTGLALISRLGSRSDAQKRSVDGSRWGVRFDESSQDARSIYACVACCPLEPVTCSATWLSWC